MSVSEASESISKNDSESTTSSFDPFLDQFKNLISKRDVQEICEIQRSLLNRFEKSNQTLVYCNELSNQHYIKLAKDFRMHTSKMNEMYKDLDSIFHRIKIIKQKLNEQYDLKGENFVQSNNDSIPDQENENGKDKSLETPNN